MRGLSITCFMAGTDAGHGALLDSAPTLRRAHTRSGTGVAASLAAALAAAASFWSGHSSSSSEAASSACIAYRTVSIESSPSLMQ